MSTDQYLEVSMDETRLVPPQNTLKPEWPKKIRNLTAQELDRLMIDSDGRFYWDSKLVNYAESQPEAPAEDKPAAQVEPVTEPQLAEQLKPSTDAAPAAEIKPTEQTRILPPVISSSSDDQVRLTLSTWQSLGLGVTIFAVLLGAFGAAAYGWVTAHDWSCRAGLVTTYCPTPSSVPKISARPELPL
jgi:hypothetical protein